MKPVNSQVVLISFFQFPYRNRIWAMAQMAAVPRLLKTGKGLSFFKMLGTGGGSGYGLKPDFKTYALLTVWDKYAYASDFETSSTIMDRFRMRTGEIYSFFLHPISSRGSWSGTNPFLPSEKETHNDLMCVITRATLKPKFYIPFWKRVKGVNYEHQKMPGLIFTKGIGERPWVMQSTFTIWRSEPEMQAFAYDKSGAHYEAIKTTRRLKGFREELFARFRPFEVRGTWRGKDPVEKFLVNEKEIHSQQK